MPGTTATALYKLSSVLLHILCNYPSLALLYTISRLLRKRSWSLPPHYFPTNHCFGFVSINLRTLSFLNQLSTG